MMGKGALKWTAYIAGGAMAVAFILPFVSRYGGTDEDGNDWQITRGSNPVVDLARENARNSFSHFATALEEAGGRTEGFEVEAELRSKRGMPTAVWLYNISIDQGRMRGTLTVSPPNGLRGGHLKGDEISFTRQQVLDWKYPENGLWRGNFVLRASFSGYSQDERDQAKQYLHESPLP